MNGLLFFYAKQQRCKIIGHYRVSAKVLRKVKTTHIFAALQAKKMKM